MPSRMLAEPIGMPSRSPTPWLRTSHGPRPSPDWAISAMPSPNPTRPTRRPGRRRMAAGVQRSRIGAC